MNRANVETDVPRKKTFEHDEAVDLAKKVFWRNGYQGVGIRGIEEQTGLGRFAINTEFGGKEGLLIAALKSYLADGETYVLTPLREGRDLGAVTGVIQSLVTPKDGSFLPYGCLVMNTTIENTSIASEQIKAVTDDYYADLRQTLGDYFARLRQGGVITDGSTIEEMVEFIVGSTIAINFLNRSACDATAGQGFADAAIKTMKGWQR